jgi:hypothetical protein
MRAFNIVALIVATALPTYAQAKIVKQVDRVTWEISDFPTLEKAALSVCESASEKGTKLVISDKLKGICADHKWPSITKAGLFRNTGAGAELNTLMRQVSNPSAPGNDQK